MRRFYCWTAILATWTILGTLRNALAKEQPLGNRVERLVVENRASHNTVLAATSASENVLGKRTKRYDAHEDQREPLTSYLENNEGPDEPITNRYRAPRDPPRDSQRERDDRNDNGLLEKPLETPGREGRSLKSNDDVKSSEEKIYRKASSVRFVKRDDSKSMVEFSGSLDERGGRERKTSRSPAKWESVERERQTLTERSVGNFPRANRLISRSLVNYANGANLTLKEPSSYESNGTRQGFRDSKRVEEAQPRLENVDVADNRAPGERRAGVTGVVEGKAERRMLSTAEKYDVGEYKSTYVRLRASQCSRADEHDPYPRAIEGTRKIQLKGNTERREMQDFARHEPLQKIYETSRGNSYLPGTKLQLRQGPTGSAARQIKGKNWQAGEAPSKGPTNPRKEETSDRRRNSLARRLAEKDPSSIGQKLKSFRESWRTRGGVAIKSEMEVAPDKRSRKPGTQGPPKDIAQLLYSGKRRKQLEGSFKDDFRKHELRTVQRTDEGDAGGRTKRELIKSSSLLADRSADIFTSNRYLGISSAHSGDILISPMQDSATKSLENQERDSPRIHGGGHKEEPAMKSTLTSAKISARSESAGYNSGGISQQNGIDAASMIESDNVGDPSGAERSSIARDIIANRLGESAAVKNFQGEFRQDEPRRAPGKTMNSEGPGGLSINFYRLSQNLRFSRSPHFKPNSTGKNFTDAPKPYRSDVTSATETKFKVSSTPRTQNFMEHVGSPLKYAISKTDLEERFNNSDAISSTYRKTIKGFTTSGYLFSIPDASSSLQSSGKNQTNLNNEKKYLPILRSDSGDDFEPDERIYSVNRPTSESIENDDHAEERTSIVRERIVSTDSENFPIQPTPLVSRGIDSETPMSITTDSADKTNGPSNEMSFRPAKIATPTQEDHLSRSVPTEIDVTNEPRSLGASLAPEIFHDNYDDNKKERTRQPELKSPEDADLSPTPSSPSSNIEQQTVITVMDDSIDATESYTHSVVEGNGLSLSTEEWQNEVLSNERQISNEDHRDGRSMGIKRDEPQKNTRVWRNYTPEQFASARPEIMVESSIDRSIFQNASGNASSRLPMYFSSFLAERFVTTAAQRDLGKPTPLGRKRSEQSNRGLTIDAAHRDTHDSRINKAKNPTGSTFSASPDFHKNRHEVIPGKSRETTTSAEQELPLPKLSTLKDERGKFQRVYDTAESKQKNRRLEITGKSSAVSTAVTVTLTDEYLRKGDHSKSNIKQEQAMNTGAIGTRTTAAGSSVVHPTWATARNDAAYLSSSPTSTEVGAKRLALQNESLHTSTLSQRSTSYQHWPMDEWMFNDEDTARRFTTGQPADHPNESADLSNQVLYPINESSNSVLLTTADNYTYNDSTGTAELPGGTFTYDDELYLALSPGNVSSNDSWDSETGKPSSRKLDNSSHESAPIDQWPVKHSAVVEGDLVLGGLMMVHEREDTVTCGPVMPQGGVQALEAMLYTLDKLNEGEGIVPGVKIGAHILDDCDKDTYGLEMAVDFIKGSISNIDGAEYHCNRTAVRKVISGVVGAASSVTSIQVANLLRLFRIPQVSFFSTSPELSNKQRFEYFTRTIPSDHYQVKAMVDIVRKMGWSYVSIIYEESNYGIKAFEELEELLKKHQICIAIKEKLVKDSGVAEETAYDNIVLKLLTKPRARGCIIFGSDQEVAGVMRAVRRCNATGAFSWIGSDGWSARGLVSDDNEPEVEGTLSVQPQANPVKGFEEYFLNLTVENNRRNPWFVEFWERHFQCRYPNASRTPYNQKYTKPCTTKERLTKQNTAFEDQLQFVSDAVMAFAYALRDMHIDLCGGQAGLCDAMKPTKGTELLKYLRKVEFEGLSGDKFKFDKNGDGPARYNIIHFKQTSPGEYKWIRVGKYLEGELRLNMSEIQFKLGHPQPPESVCSLPCEVGQAKKYVEGERCCWHCFNCTQYQIRDPDDETQCIACRQGAVPDETHSTCRDIPEEFLRPESGWAIGAMSFSATGILVTLFVGGVFLRHNDTPVVRASGRELSYVLLSGILLCYLVTFALVLRPTDIVCGIQRFAAGFCFTVVYAALLTKTNRILRIFNASKRSAKRPSFISPRSQLIICSGLVGVQILINGVWMVIDPARAMHHYPTREDNLLVCNSYIDASYMIAFTYPIILIVVCTIYAVLTRKTPEAFNESKHIGFTMYTTCVIWLAFVPLYFGTGNHVALRITSMSVTISLSASVTIACLFSPKLYIILIRPERNVRQSMMPTRYSTTKNSAVSGTNASNMMAHVTLTAVTCNQKDALKKHVKTTVDGFTQSEYHELEPMDQKNGKPAIAVVSRDTQTPNNNNESAMDGEKDPKENATSSKPFNRIGNGPVSQSDVSL